MKIEQKILITLLVLMPTLFFSSAGQTREMYRYKTLDGVTVMDYRVPPEAAHRGYQVLNEEGVVIREVAARLTGEELAVLNQEARTLQEAEAEAGRLREWDESLLLRYSSIEDIDAAQIRALRNLEIRVDILNSNKRSLRQQVENYQTQAADLERTAQPVDEALLSAITTAQEEIVSIDRAIADRMDEIAEVRQSFESDKARFETLIDVVEMRRTMTTKSDSDSP